MIAAAMTAAPTAVRLETRPRCASRCRARAAPISGGGAAAFPDLRCFPELGLERATTVTCHALVSRFRSSHHCSRGANTLATLGANTLVGDDGNDMFVLFAGSADGATVADFDRSEEDVLCSAASAPRRRARPSVRGAPAAGRVSAGASRHAGAFVMRDYHCGGKARLRFIN